MTKLLAEHYFCGVIRNLQRPFGLIQAGALLLSVLSFTGCSPGDKDYRDISDFYFPYESLSAGSVYLYRNPAEPDAPADAWSYQSFREDDKWLLTCQNYDQALQVRQFQLESIVPTGVLSDAYVLYERGKDGQLAKVKADIDQANLFPFFIRDTAGVYIFSLHWKDAADSLKETTLVRNRRFLKDTSFAYRGEVMDAIVFEVRDLIELEEEGILSVETTGIEVYARGLGLVRRTRRINESLSLEFTLDTIVSMDHFLQPQTVRH